MESPDRRGAVLAVCCMSLFIVGLDVTIANIALPGPGVGGDHEPPGARHGRPGERIVGTLMTIERASCRR